MSTAEKPYVGHKEMSSLTGNAEELDNPSLEKLSQSELSESLDNTIASEDHKNCDDSPFIFTPDTSPLCPTIPSNFQETIGHETTRSLLRHLHLCQRFCYISVLGCVLFLFVTNCQGTQFQDHVYINSGQGNIQNQRSFSLEEQAHIGKQQSSENPNMFRRLHRNLGITFRLLKNSLPLGSFDPEPGRTPQLVVAGKMSVNGSDCNIAQMNLLTGEWNSTDCVQLDLYNSFYGGDVYALLANHTTVKVGKSQSDKKKVVSTDTKSENTEELRIDDGGDLIVVGAFDTTYKNSQVTYCSVGKWNGVQLSKVGEGLCNSALSRGMKITSAALADKHNVYVAGSFVTQVWSGEKHEFVKIYNLAHYNATEQVWLPLEFGQITCSWCTVTILALAWDSKRNQLHVGGKFNAIDGRNIPAGLAIYNRDNGHLVAHPGGGLAMNNVTQDGVTTALQLDEESGVLYVMGSFTRLTSTMQFCQGLAAYEIVENRWTCLADPKHSVLPSGGGNMLLTQYGLMVSGLTTPSTTWEHPDRPYTIALLSSTVKSTAREFNWTWLPGFPGHNLPLNALSNGFGEFSGTVFIGGDNFIAQWSYEEVPSSAKDESKGASGPPKRIPVTRDLSSGVAKGTIMALSQLTPLSDSDPTPVVQRSSFIGYTLVIYFMALGSVLGIFLTIMCNKSVTSALLSLLGGDNRKEGKGISLDTLTYSAIENTNIQEAYHRAMETRFVHDPRLLTLIDPHEIYLHRIIGEGTFGRVWSAKWMSSSVAVKEFVFAQAAVAGKSSMQGEIIEEIIGEAGMMAILRHPYVLQLFGCSLTAQAIWIVSELCSLGSLRQLLDRRDRDLSLELRLQLALHVAEGMTYLHNQNPPIIHRDLKSHNIFVHETFTDTLKTRKGSIDGQGKNKNRIKSQNRGPPLSSESTVVAKIGDWGSARATLSGSRTMTHGVGTACWLAPEVIKHARSSKYSDVYSFAIVLWELATREEVYLGLETTQIIARVAGDQLRPEIPQDCLWKDIMIQCWNEVPSKRPTFDKIVVYLDRILRELKKDSGSDLTTVHDFPESYHNSK